MRFENAYAALKDRLFDYGIAHEHEPLGEFAYWLSVHLPMTKGQREVYERLFGAEG